MLDLPEILPPHDLSSHWEPWTDEKEQKARAGSPMLAEIKQAFLDACRKPGWNPRTVQMGGVRLAVDYCAHSWYADKHLGFYRPGLPRLGPKTGDLHSYKVVSFQDHPFLAVLNQLPHVPRAVRSLYRKEVRLAHLRADDGFVVIRAVDAAQSAWDEWLEVRAREVVAHA